MLWELEDGEALGDVALEPDGEALGLIAVADDEALELILGGHAGPRVPDPSQLGTNVLADRDCGAWWMAFWAR